MFQVDCSCDRKVSCGVHPHTSTPYKRCKKETVLYLGLSVNPDGAVFVYSRDTSFFFEVSNTNTGDASVNLKSLTYSGHRDQFVVRHVVYQIVVNSLVNYDFVGNLVLGLSLCCPLLLLGGGLVRLL